MASFLAGVLAVLAVFMSTAAGYPSDDDHHHPANPWLPFQNLTGCHDGEERQGLADLKKYLSNFGYMLPSSSFSDTFDDDIKAAIVTYQRNFGLNASGALDAATVNQMMAPRCGVADVFNGTSTMSSGSAAHGRNLYAYFPDAPSWPVRRRSLKYALTATSASSIGAATLRDVFARAFARWSAVTTINFTEASSPADADITIGFYSGAHGDGEAFDGVLGTLAHAFSPTDGRFHLDAAETWIANADVTTASSDVAVDLESVAVHEIGHLLGLGHSSAADAVMYPTIRTRTRKVDLAGDDVQGIQGLYGSNPNYRGMPTTTSNRETQSSAAVAPACRGTAKLLFFTIAAVQLLLSLH